MSHPTKSKNPLVSIIIPCYNQGEFLHEAIQSIKTNGYSPIEIILVDDASTDPETPQIIAQLESSSSSGVQCIRLPKNSGVSYARNTGIKSSSGEYIICLDADDKLHPGCIHTSLKILSIYPEAGFVYGNYQCFGESERFYRGGIFAKLPLSLGILKIAPASMFRKKAWAKIGGYDENRRNRIEDWDFWYRLAKATYFGIYHDFLALNYRRTRKRKYAPSRYEESTRRWFDTALYLFSRHKNPLLFFLALSMGLDRMIIFVLRLFGKEK